MDFKETMNIIMKILAMVDKIYHAVVKNAEDAENAEDADKEESDEIGCIHSALLLLAFVFVCVLCVLHDCMINLVYHG